MTPKKIQTEESRSFFIDEAGDLTLFNKKRQVMLGKKGVSHTFMLGVALIPEPDVLNQQLEALRQSLLADPYFAGIPSFDPKENKTAVFFHAKNDLPEVRREVFKILQATEAKVFVTIRRKADLAEFSARSFEFLSKKVTDNEIYDDLVKRTFKQLLHKADENHLIFARRGTSTRQHALEEAIKKAKYNFNFNRDEEIDKPTFVYTAEPSMHGGLQLIDYYLWALQRLYERGEDRHFNLLTENYRRIIDMDDKREKPYGMYYTDSNPLTRAKIKPILS